jgi:hypothetical protein
VSIRRLFWRGAAGTLVLGALLAISAVLGAGGGEETWRALGTLGVGFLCGSVALASLVCLERGVIRPAAMPTLAVAVATFLGWTDEIWAGHDDTGWWKVLGILGVWTLAGALVTALRLVARHPRVLSQLYPATAGSAVAAALTASVLVLRENGDGWQLLAILGILAAVGSLLTPVAEKLLAPVAESRLRALGVVRGVALLAGPASAGAPLVVRAERGRLRVLTEAGELELADGESLLLRLGE